MARRTVIAALLAGMLLGGLLTISVVQENLGYDFYDPDGNVYFGAIAVVFAINLVVAGFGFALIWLAGEWVVAQWRRARRRNKHD